MSEKVETATKIAERLLPCSFPKACSATAGHYEDCRVFLRPAVAAAIEAARKQGAAEDDLAARVLAMCQHRGWSLHWTARGAYLHLESSELIEALRGKRGTVLGEAGDVLLVLMSITENAGIPWSEVVAQADKTCEELMTKPHYKGEEFDAIRARGLES